MGWLGFEQAEAVGSVVMSYAIPEPTLDEYAALCNATEQV